MENEGSLSRESILTPSSERSDEDQTEVENVDDDSKVESDTAKPVDALCWAMQRLDNGSGATKGDIAKMLGSKYHDQRDKNFSRKVDVVLRDGLDFGLLQRHGDRYSFSDDFIEKASASVDNDTQKVNVAKPQLVRYYKVESTEDVRRKRSGSIRSRSPLDSASSESSSEETEGVVVIEWALAKLGDKRGSTFQCIKDIVGNSYRKFRNFDRLLHEAIEEAISTNVVEKNGKRYRLKDW